MSYLRKRRIANFRLNASSVGKALKSFLPASVPTKGQIIGKVGQVLKNPGKSFAEGMARDRAANAVAKSMGHTRMGLVREGVKQAGKSIANNRSAIARGVKRGTAKLLKNKDLVVNTGGFVGSKVGAAMGGSIGGLAGDNLGAFVTRRAYDDVMAVRKGFQAAKQTLGTKKAKLLAGAKTTAKEIKQNLLHKKKDYAGDQVGWAIGNGAAEGLSRGGVDFPFKGAVVAMRTAPSVTEGAVKILKGSPVKQTLKETGKEIIEKNNMVKVVRRGNARERLMRRKINRKLQEIHSNYHYYNRRLTNFSRRALTLLPSLNFGYSTFYA